MASQVAAIRAHSGYGAQFSDGRNPNAPQGLALPTPPAANCVSNVVNVTSLAQFNTEAAGSCKRVVLTPSATPYVGWARITGQDIEAVFTGATISPNDDSWALQVTEDAARVKTVGGTFNNLYVVGGNRWSPGGSLPNFVRDVHIYGATFVGAYTQGLSSTYYGDGANARAHRFLLERTSIRSANGGFFIESGSTNMVLANSNIVVPNFGARHENPVRVNGGDLVVLLDTRLRTETSGGYVGPIKHTWRSHGSTEGAGGRILVRGVQSEGGGSMGQYPGVEFAEAQSTFLAVQGWRYYRAPDVEGNNIFAFPHLNIYAGSPYLGAVMNAEVWMDDNTVYYDGLPAGTSILGASNAPPGPVTRSVYAPYQAAPAWTFK